MPYIGPGTPLSAGGHLRFSQPGFGMAYTKRNKQGLKVVYNRVLFSTHRFLSLKQIENL